MTSAGCIEWATVIRDVAVPQRYQLIVGILGQMSDERLDFDRSSIHEHLGHGRERYEAPERDPRGRGELRLSGRMPFEEFDRTNPCVVVYLSSVDHHLSALRGSYKEHGVEAL